MSKRMNQSDIIVRCISLVERDHGGCEQHTCDICTSLREGCGLWAMNLWAGSGAYDDEFYDLFSQLGPKFERDARKEAAIVASVPSIDCGHCYAIIRYPDEVGNECCSCGKNAIISRWPDPRRARRMIRVIGGNDWALNTGPRGELRLVGGAA